jgi:hypothetical protein
VDPRRALASVPYHLLTVKCHCWVGGAHTLYLESTGFKSLFGYRLSRLGAFLSSFFLFFRVKFGHYHVVFLSILLVSNHAIVRWFIVRHL